MKKILSIYDYCRMPIRISYLGFALLAIGFLIQSESVNIFYTFSNQVIILIGNACFTLGQTIIVNLPFVFLLSIVSKRANNTFPPILAVIGYVSFLVATILFTSSNYNVQYYCDPYSFSSIVGGGHLPIETGLIGTIIVGFITRFSFIHSRHRSSYDLMGFLNPDTEALIYNIFLCFLAGMGLSFLFPYFQKYLQSFIDYIATDISDPLRIGLYGFADRLFSLFGLGKLIRYPFWYTSLGGSYTTAAGQTILGDVNIWQAIKGVPSSFYGCGRFVAPYYVINMFMIPAFFIGFLFLFSDRKERSGFILPVIFACLFSFICGNPLPMEMLLLVSAPVLYLLYLVLVAVLFGLLSYLNIYLGCSSAGDSILTVLPGNFPDFIINIRNAAVFDNIVALAVIGAVMFLICLFLSRFYYHSVSGLSIKNREFYDDLISGLGGKDNICSVSSGFLRINIGVEDALKASAESIAELDVGKVSENRDGFSIETGSSSYYVAKKINDMIFQEDDK